jgi:hypothetical protein
LEANSGQVVDALFKENGMLFVLVLSIVAA